MAELTHQVHTATLASLARRDRQHRLLRARLDAHDQRRRLAAVRARLVAAETRLHASARQRHERARSGAATLAARLDNLSPLAVLGRGYAVCWNADRTAIVRRASTVNAGDYVRVTLHEGELYCEVRPENHEN